MRIGILALQGAFYEHERSLSLIGASSFEIRQKRDIERSFDALIIPGGESTVIGKLLHSLNLFDSVKNLIQNGMPVWGTCAGMILLAKKVEGEKAHLGLMDITVRRNAYGKQIDSFAQNVSIPSVSPSPIPLVFIRAPWIEKAEQNVDVLCKLNCHIVAAKQDNMLVTSFHPELTDNTEFHKYFLKMANHTV